MSNDEKTEKIIEALRHQDVFKCRGVQDVNHKPHPYTLGPRHIAHSTMITEQTCREVPCAHPKCGIPYDEHTSDNVAFLQSIRNSTASEANTALKALVEYLGESFVDGFAFVESEFEITEDE